MDKEELNKQQELAKTILEKCKELGCEGPNDTAELIGGATLVCLNIFAGYMGELFDDVRTEYVRALSAAEIL